MRAKVPAPPRPKPPREVVDLSQGRVRPALVHGLHRRPKPRPPYVGSRIPDLSDSQEK
jgi:hypothetical protein